MVNNRNPYTNPRPYVVKSNDEPKQTNDGVTYLFEFLVQFKDIHSHMSKSEFLFIFMVYHIPTLLIGLIDVLMTYFTTSQWVYFTHILFSLLAIVLTVPTISMVVRRLKTVHQSLASLWITLSFIVFTVLLTEYLSIGWYISTGIAVLSSLVILVQCLYSRKS